MNRIDFVFVTQGFLNWTHVDKDARELTVRLKPMMYHFAISANSERASSGMVWASCSMSKDKGKAHLKRDE